MTTSILKPGILVSLKTSLSGGVQYLRRDLDTEAGAEGESIVRWETTRKIEDPSEHERATKTRNMAASLIRRVCAHTAFGLLCPATRESDLDAAIAAARAEADLFNAGSQHAKVHVYILKGRIATTDEEAARAIASEVRGLLDEMRNGILRADVKAVREAASRARQVGAVLDEANQTKVNMAIEMARAAAKEIVRQVEGEGKEAASVIAQLAGNTAAIDTVRFSFLDLDGGVEIAPLPVTTARDLEVSQ